MQHSGPRGASVICDGRGEKRGRAAAVCGLFVGAFFLVQSTSLAQVSNLYSTGFELTNGFDARYTLIGQGCTPAGRDCWTGTDTHANLIVSDFFSPKEMFGQQQAFIGAYVLTNQDGILNVWRPLNFDPVAAALPVVTFYVTLSIYDSLDVTNRDSFRWSIYNMHGGGERLFSIDFDNRTLNINYVLDDENLYWTGDSFENADRGGQYDLVVIMNFADNLWSAWSNDEQIVNSKPLKTKSVPPSID